MKPDKILFFSEKLSNIFHVEMHHVQFCVGLKELLQLGKERKAKQCKAMNECTLKLTPALEARVEYELLAPKNKLNQVLYVE